MGKFEQLRTRIEALQALLTEAMKDLEALEAGEQEPPVVDPPLPEEPPPVDEPDEPDEVPTTRLSPLKLLDHFEWPVDPARIGNPVGRPNSTWVVRQGKAAAGRFATFAFDKPGGRLVAGQPQKIRTHAWVTEEGGEPKLELTLLYQGKEVKPLATFALTADPNAVHEAEFDAGDLPGTNGNLVSIRYKLLTDVPAKHYVLESTEWVPEHDGSGVQEGELEPVEPPTPPGPSIPGYELFWSATPADADLTRDPKLVNDWFKQHFGQTLRGEPGDALRIDKAPDGRPAIEHRFMAGKGNKGRSWQCYSTGIQGANRRNFDTVRMSLDIWIDDKLSYEKTGIKLFGHHIGGDVMTPSPAKPKDQNGSYSRIVITQDGTRLGRYNYDLDRSFDKNAAEHWGAQTNAGTKLIKGRWVTLWYEVKLNTPGKQDGHALLWQDGNLIINQGGIESRKSGWGWDLNSINLTVAKDVKFKAGSIWFSNFRLYGK